MGPAGPAKRDQRDTGGNAEEVAMTTEDTENDGER
jgi:hypothetical protein